MVTAITVLHVLVCLFLVLVVLLQAGKGGGLGLTFGANTSAAVFGGRGASNFLERLTAITAALFMLTSMTLAYFSSQSDSLRLQRKAVARKVEAVDKSGNVAKQLPTATASEKPTVSPAARSEPAQPAAPPTATGNAVPPAARSEPAQPATPVPAKP